MAPQPLQPISAPASLAHAANAVGSGTLVTWFLYAVCAFWLLYTLMAVYHWKRYAHAPKVASRAIGIHLVVSLVLIAYALSGAVALH